MCGSIRKSESPEEAVEFALAYAKSYVTSIWTEEENNTPNNRRAIANDFIEEYTPARQRESARQLLSGRTDDQLSTELSYWDDVVEYY